MNQQITTREGRKLYVQNFDGMSDFVEYATTQCKPKNQKMFDNRLKEDRGMDWFGVSNVSTVEAVIRDGWQEGTKRMLDAMSKFSGNFQAVSLKRRLVRGDRGDELDVHRVMRGEIDKAWSRRERSAGRKSSVVTLACDLMMLGNVDPSELFWRGAAVTRLADILTDVGYAVEIVGFIDSEKCDNAGTWDIQQTIVIKRADMPMDLNTLSSVLCLAGFFRHYGLMSRCCIDEKLGGHAGFSNYSAKLEYPSAHLIRANGAQIRTQEQAEAWLAGRLAEFEARHAEAA